MSFNTCPTEIQQLIFQHAINIDKSHCYAEHLGTDTTSPMDMTPAVVSSTISDPTHLINMKTALGIDLCTPILEIAKERASRDLEVANEAIEEYEDDEDSDDQEVIEKRKTKEYKSKMFKAYRTRNACRDHYRMLGTALLAEVGHRKRWEEQRQGPIQLLVE